MVLRTFAQTWSGSTILSWPRSWARRWTETTTSGKLPMREWTAADATERPFTDDWAPVEWVIDQLIVRVAESGIER